MFICASVTASLFTQRLLMSPRPCEVSDSVAMLPSSLTSLFEPIGEGFQPAEACDLQSSLASLQAVCDSLMGPVNSNTQTRTILMQHEPACSLHTESRVILHLRPERERNSLVMLWVWVKKKHFIHPIVLSCLFPLKTLFSLLIPRCVFAVLCDVQYEVKIAISQKMDG